MKSTLYINGKVWQTDGTFIQAFGVTDGKISFTGSNQEASALKNYYNELIDLEGRLVLPGFTDGHVHMVKGSIINKALDCSEVKDIKSLKEKISKYREKTNIRLITGRNINLGQLLKNSPHISGDDICSDIPMLITNYDYHSALCNTLTMKETGLFNRLSEFGTGDIEFKNGYPTGIIREKAYNYISSKLSEPDIEYKTHALIECIYHFNSLGITAVSDITLPPDLEVYSKVYSKGHLKLRINSYLPFDEFKNLSTHRKITEHIPREFFEIKGFKAFWDGALGSETALFSKNYKATEHNGCRTQEVISGEVKEIAQMIDKLAMQMKIHAIGDLAVREVIELYSSLPNTKRLRHRIEHAQHIAPDLYPEFWKSGIIASVQPVHMKYDISAVKSKLPEDLQNITHNYLPVLKLGGIINFGTDFPIAEPNPFKNLKFALLRDDGSGTFTGEYSFNLNDAIRCYTINNAFANHNEKRYGSITKGMLADFIIMDGDIFEMSPEKIHLTSVAETYIGGEKIYP